MSADWSWWDLSKYLCMGEVPVEDEECRSSEAESSTPDVVSQPAASREKRLKAARDRPVLEQAVKTVRSDGSSSSSRGSSSDSDDAAEKPAPPELVSRSCTDIWWAMLFMLLVIALAALSIMGAMSGDYANVITVKDGAGTACGRDKFAYDTFLYFCNTTNGTLDFTSPTCRSSCPDSDGVDFSCYNNATSSWYPSEDYATFTSFAAVTRLCWPKDRKLFGQLLEYVRDGYPAIAFVSMLPSTVLPLLYATIAGFAVSFGYIMLLKESAYDLVMSGVRIIVLFPWGWAVYLYVRYGKAAMVWSILLGVSGALMARLACFYDESLQYAGGMIQGACKCVIDTPQLRFGPFLVLGVRVAITIGMLHCLKYLCTGMYFDITSGQPVLDCSEHQNCASTIVNLSLWAFGVLWMHNLFTACWEFAIAYATTVWYFREVKCCRSPCKLGRVLLRYHAGTMAYAALVIGVLRPIRFLMGTTTAATRLERSVVGEIVQACCGCFVDIYEEHLERLSSYAYLEVAIGAYPLCQAADKAHQMTSHSLETSARPGHGEPVTFRQVSTLMHGATFMFQAVCLTFIWWVGYFLVFTITNGIVPGSHKYADPYSVSYVQYKQAWSDIGGFLAAFAAYPNLMLFGNCTEAILYNVTRELLEEKKRKKKKGKGLKSMFDFFGYLVSSLQSASSSASTMLQSSSSSESLM
eukprot:TRINITY_DN39352_c0_g1_i2.p1 TRINITY_DN39352_c0_g1~~TRINITY_DN39352_c0_g1_i2.p1  ORF type:complete len:693 (-),score=93.53 TRINITY_DN39352_c0_g1_i2:45-2123(-)